MADTDPGPAVEYPDIFSAIMSDDLDAVEAMLAVASWRAARHEGRSPVLLAAYRHRRDALEALLRRQPPLDVFEAAATGDVETVRLRTDERAERAHIYSEDGLTALHLAAYFGHSEAARVLIERGARPGAISRDDAERAPLHLAAAGGHLDMAALLLERGARPDPQERGGTTPLHTAARRGDDDLARLLLAHGARRDMETDAGKTAADLAYEFEHDSLATYLRSRDR